MATRFLLPPEAYFDDGWFEQEQRALFGRSWHLAAAVEELVYPGDFVTLVAGRDPLLVIRGADGELRAFHNFCRHRGHQLLEQTGNARTGIVCPYHFWNFAIDGSLRRVPQEAEFAAVDLAGYGLLPAAVAIGRTLRSGIVHSLRSDYVRTARAKGLRERTVLLRHTLRNSSGAALSMTGLQVGLMFAGVVVVESIFAWPGIGFYTVQSIPRLDFPAIAGVTLLLGAAYVVVNTAVDILQGVADPRLRI